MSEPVIKVTNLKKYYKVGDSVVKALRGVNFEINKGELVAIVGTSGSGKSTLLNMLAGLETPTSGEVVIANKHIEKLNEDKLVKFRQKHVGFIFQSYNLMANMTALENVSLPLTFRGISKDKREKLAKQALKLVGLSGHEKHRPTQMSGGQQQRVGIARALVLSPEIIFADEPTGNLDTETSEEVMNLMKKLVVDKKQTLIMVTHDDYLTEYADRVFRLVDGEIVSIEVNDRKKENPSDKEE